MLGLAFHPLFESNRRFFVFYTQAGDGTLVVAEYTASAVGSNTANTTERRILEIPHPLSNHNGGMLAFDRDGYLHIGVGDGGGANDPDDNAQDVNTLLGKILRIDINSSPAPYHIPVDNPFATTAGMDEIYAYGMRNPWRFSFDRLTGQQWVGDVGQGAREEVDSPIANGGNYGWRVFEGNACTGLGPAPCVAANYIAPVFDYTHANGRCSLTGGYVYRGSQGAIPSGNYVYGDYCSGEILSWNGSVQSVLLDTTQRVSSFGEDEQGELYVVDITGGAVSRIVASTPPPPPPTCTYSINPTQASFGRAGGNGTVTVTAPAGCAWTAVRNASWITVTAGASGSGNGTVSYTVSEIKPKRRTGTLTIAGGTFTVTQTK